MFYLIPFKTLLVQLHHICFVHRNLFKVFTVDYIMLDNEIQNLVSLTLSCKKASSFVY